VSEPQTAETAKPPGFQLDPAVLAAASAPIRADAPVGENVRYEPSFEALEAEIAKLEQIDAQPVDWRKVVELGETILTTQSKDFGAACYFAHGLVDQRGYRGLAEGLTLVDTLAATYWDDMFPPTKRARARAGAVEWWLGRLERWLADNAPTEADAAAVVHAADALMALEARLGEKLGDRAPPMGDVRRALVGLADEAKRTLATQADAAARSPDPSPAPNGNVQAAATDGQPAPKPEPAEEAAKPNGADHAAQPAAQPAPPAAQPAAPAPKVELADPGGDVAKGLRQIQAALRPLAEHLRAQSLADPRGYRLLRTAIWLPVAQLPPHDGEQTQIPAPDPNLVASLATMAKSGKHDAVIARAEESVVAAPFWLDPHRFTAAALEALGHGAARAAVEASVRELLTRLPELPDLRLDGGTPVADDATQQWLRERVLAGDGPAGAAGEAEPWTDALRAARTAAGERGFKAGLAVFQNGIRRAPSERARFLWSLNQATFCLGQGRPELALAQMVVLDDQVHQFGLHRWEPEIAIESARNLMLSYRNIKTDQVDQDDMKNRISRATRFLATADPASAAELLGG
jgi:type VI secretion system protein VasJ